MPKPAAADVDNLAKWEEVNAQALSMILMNIVLNMQAGPNGSSVKAAWDGLMGCYTQVDPIAQNCQEWVFQPD